MRRRIVLIVIIAGVVGGIVGGLWWYAQARRISQQLVRAELALQAQKFDRAAELAQGHVAEQPDDWRGYYVLAKANSRLGRYEQAREGLERLLSEAERFQPDRTMVGLLLAETYSTPARRSLAPAEAQEQTETLRRAIGLFRQANEVLAGLAPTEGKRALDVREVLGLNQMEMGQALQALGGRLGQAGQIAQEAGAAEASAARRQEASSSAAEGEQSLQEATAALLEVVREDSSRQEAALGLVRLCGRRGDRTTLAAAREAVLGASNPPPVAAMLIVLDDLAQAVGEKGVQAGPAERAKAQEAAGKLDELIERNPREVLLKIARADLAWRMLGDAARAERLVGEALKESPRHPDGRLLEGRLLLAGGKAAEAEQKLFALKTEFPQWPAAQFAFAQAAMTTGKEELARETMRLVTQLEPGHPGASRYLAEALLRDGFGQQAFADAQAYYEKHPEDPTALRLFVACARATDQPEGAQKALETARRAYASRPQMMMAVAEGYALAGEEAASVAAARQAAGSRAEGLADRLAVAQALRRVGRAAEGEKMLLRLVQEGEGVAEAQYELGQLYQNTGRAGQAMRAYREAVRREGQNGRYRLALAQSLLNAGEAAGGEEVLRDVSGTDGAANLLRVQARLMRGEAVEPQRALEEVKGTERGAARLARVYLDGGRAEACAAVCEQELKKTPDNAELHGLRAQAYQALGRTEACLQERLWLLQRDPKELSNYMAAAELLSGSLPPGRVGERLAAVRGAETDPINLVVGQLYERAGDYLEAARAYMQVVGRAGASEGTRSRARLVLAGMLGQMGQVDEALRQLAQVSGEAPFGWAAQVQKAQLLAEAGRKAEAGPALKELCEAAAAGEDVGTLRQAAQWYARLGEFEEALAVCGEVDRLLPEDPGPCVLRGSILAGAGRWTEAAPWYEKAIERQPGNFELHVTYARALDEQQQERQALEVLERLAGQGEEGRARALGERARLLMSLGLPAEAARGLEELSKLRPSDRGVQVNLGRALIAQGQRERARQVLEGVSAEGGEYVAARQLLASLAEDVDEKLAILRGLEGRDGQATVRQQVMTVLLEGNRPKEAVEAYREYVAKRGGAAPTTEMASLAVQAMLRAEDWAGAGELSLSQAEATGAPLWRQWAAVLAQDDAARERVAKLLPGAEQGDLRDVLAGLYLAACTGEAQKVQPWLERLGQLGPAMSGQGGGALAPYRLLAEVATGGVGQVAQRAERGEADAVYEEAAKELVSYAGAGEGRGEAVRLLRSTLAIDLGMPGAARAWLSAVLTARPQSQYAAALMLRANPDKALLGKVADTVQPADCLVWLAVQAERKMEQGEYEQAAALYRRAGEWSGDGRLALQQGVALENAGDLAGALEQYRQAWEKTGNPVAANNAAYVQCELTAGDAVRLAEAQGWAAAAAAAAPGQGGFHDTLGWVLHQQGKMEEACRELRGAVKAGADSPEIHYHLGLAETAAGDKELGRWHLSAAVEWAEARQRRGERSSAAERKAMEQARAALAGLAAKGG